VQTPESWTTSIKPKNKLLQVDFSEIWQYRGLLSMFVKRDIVTQYKQTILGPAWYFIQPALTIIFTFIVQLWMYATPVIYPLSTMFPKRQWIMALNPVTSILEAFKYGTMGVGTFNRGHLAYSFVFMLVFLGLGVVVFNKVQRSFMDTV